MSQSDKEAAQRERLAFLAAGGEMGKLIRSIDWSQTPLGPIDSWSQTLRTTVSLCLASNFPISIAWGPQRVQIYNDGFWHICGAKHPTSMGQDFKECWASAWPAIGDAFERASAGEPAFVENQRMFLDRDGYLEEAFFTYSFSPIRDEAGGVGGLFHPVTETTQQTLAERRLKALHDLAESTADAKTVAAACDLIAQTISPHNVDLPFALLYLLDGDGRHATLAVAAGLVAGTDASPERLELCESTRPFWPLAEAVRGGEAIEMNDLEARFGQLVCGPYPESPSTALVLPILLDAFERPFAILMAGVSARRALDEPYREFYLLLGEAVTTALANARAHQEERRKAAVSLGQCEQRYREVVGQVKDYAIFRTDLEGRAVTWNEGVQRVLDLDEDEFIGKDVTELIFVPEDVRAGVPQKELEQAARYGTASNDRCMRRKNGEQFFAQGTTTAIKDEQGRVTGFTKIMRDYTRLKEAEDSLRESEERFRVLVAAASQAVWETNAEGKVVDDSPAWRAFTGQTLEEWLEHGWLHAVHPEDRERAERQWRAAVAAGRYLNTELRLRNTRSGWQWTNVHVAPIHDRDGAVVKWAGMNLDISERKRAEEALRDADRRKDEFLATLAHELRNPLAPVRNVIQILRMKSPASPELQWARDVIDRQVQQMTRLIDDLMDVSRISQNKLDLRKESVELAKVVEMAVETSRPIIDDFAHQLTVSLPPEPIRLDADLTRLAQVFSNLLNNAARYMEPYGHIWLTAERQGNEVVVSVRDIGIGIDAEQLPRIFDIFSQVDRSLERSQGGLGIGLTLVKQLVEMHDGTVEATSDGLGRGAEFMVRLPVEAVERSTGSSGKPDEPAALESAMRILIVDDNRDSAESLAMMLQMLGHDIRVAHDGKQGADAAEEFRPAVVLLDIGLPSMNGYEVCRHIRSQPWGGDMIVVALTGWGQEEDRRKSSEAGFDHHIVKPINPRDLMTILAER